MNALFAAIMLAQVAGGTVPPGQPAVPAPAVQAAPAAAVQAAPLPVAGAPAPVQVPPQIVVTQAPAPAQEAPPQGGGWQMLVFFAVMILVFWLLIIRPQSKQKKQQEAFLSALNVGDRVVTASGLIGRIASMEAEVVTLELAKDVRVRVLKSSVSTHFKEGGEKESKSS